MSGPSIAERVELSYSRMGGHAACGKKQYKSAVCKAKAIMARVEEGEEPTARQVQFVTSVARNAFLD